MSIAKISGFQTSDGTVFIREDEAKKHEAKFQVEQWCSRHICSEYDANDVADAIMEYREELMHALEGREYAAATGGR